MNFTINYNRPLHYENKKPTMYNAFYISSNSFVLNLKKKKTIHRFNEITEICRIIAAHIESLLAIT